jgi:hypothetical protein
MSLLLLVLLLLLALLLLLGSFLSMGSRIAWPALPIMEFHTAGMLFVSDACRTLTHDRDAVPASLMGTMGDCVACHVQLAPLHGQR